MAIGRIREITFDDGAVVVGDETLPEAIGESDNIAGTLVKRDENGDFAAGTITADLDGNASTADSATTAGTAVDFTGSLSGDVTGTQSATAIAATTVTGKALTGFTSGAGTVAATDSILQAVQKLDGNINLERAITTDTAEPMGMVGSPTYSYLGTRTIRIAAPFSYYYKGQKVTVSSNKDVQVPNVTGLYWLHFPDATGTPTYTTSLNLLEHVIYRGFYWNATTSDYMFLNENHGITWASSLHQEQHLTVGAKYQSGATASGYTLGSDTLANIQIALDQLVFWDEDLQITQAARAKTDNWDKWYRSGANGDWRKDTADAIPAFHAANVPKINTFSSPNWVLTDVTANYYFNVYIIGTNSAESANRFILIPGQNQSLSLSGAQAFTISNLSLGSLPAAELPPLYQVTCQYKVANNGNDARITIEAITDLRRSTSPGVSAGVNTNHNSLSGRSDSNCHPSTAITGTAVTLAGAEVVTNKDIDGGTASNTSRLTIPKNTTANLAALTRKEATLVWDTTAKKLFADDGSALKTIGGGLITEYKDALFTAEAGKHYLCNMASGSYTATLPAGAAESVIMFTTFGNTANANRLTLDGNGSETITYNDVAYTDVVLLPSNGWCQLSWDATNSTWRVDDSANFVAGTFTGNLTVTGSLTPSGGIVGRTSGVAPTSTQIGYSFSSAGTNRTLTSGDANTVNAGSITLPAGTWLVWGIVYFEVQTNPIAWTMLHASIGTVSGTHYSGAEVQIGPNGSTVDHKFPLPARVITTNGSDSSANPIIVASAIFTGAGSARTNGAQTVMYALRLA